MEDVFIVVHSCHLHNGLWQGCCTFQCAPMLSTFAALLTGSQVCIDIAALQEQVGLVCGGVLCFGRQQHERASGLWSASHCSAAVQRQPTAIMAGCHNSCDEWLEKGAVVFPAVHRCHGDCGSTGRNVLLHSLLCAPAAAAAP